MYKNYGHGTDGMSGTYIYIYSVSRMHILDYVITLYNRPGRLGNAPLPKFVVNIVIQHFLECFFLIDCPSHSLSPATYGHACICSHCMTIGAAISKLAS